MQCIALRHGKFGWLGVIIKGQRFISVLMEVKELSGVDWDTKEIMNLKFKT